MSFSSSTLPSTMTEYVDLEEPFELERWLDGVAGGARSRADVCRTEVSVDVGAAGSVSGIIQFARGRVALGIAGIPLFDVPLRAIRHVYFPWWRFGAGVRFRADGENWRLTFDHGSGRFWRTLLMRRSAGPTIR